MRLAAGLEQQHLVAAVLGEAIGERGAGRACTNDDKVGRADVHAVSVPTFWLIGTEDTEAQRATASADRACGLHSALILRSDAKHRVSKDGPNAFGHGSRRPPSLALRRAPHHEVRRYAACFCRF